jgi:hypothetical protein
MYGSAKINGHAFCLGVSSLGIAKEEQVMQVVTLIEGAIFRSRQIPRNQGRLSLGIRSLGELVDVYHAHQATKFHDKIYALLGICTDDPVLLRAAGLEPDHSLEPKKLMEHLVQFLLGNQVSTKTWKDKEMAVIKCKGYAFGWVSKAKSSTNSGKNGYRSHFQRYIRGRRTQVRPLDSPDLRKIHLSW